MMFRKRRICVGYVELIDGCFDGRRLKVCYGESLNQFMYFQMNNKRWLAVYTRIAFKDGVTYYEFMGVMECLSLNFK